MPRTHVVQIALAVIAGVAGSIWLVLDPPDPAPMGTSYLPQATSHKTTTAAISNDGSSPDTTHPPMDAQPIRDNPDEQALPLIEQRFD